MNPFFVFANSNIIKATMINDIHLENVLIAVKTDLTLRFEEIFLIKISSLAAWS